MAESVMIACEMLSEEIEQILPPGMTCKFIDSSLHLYPEKLREEIQRAVNEISPRVESIILGFGLCSRAVEGVCSQTSRIIIPRVDDCIGVLLGSRKRYMEENKIAPGSYYLTGKWLDGDVSLFSEFKRMVKKWGQDRANSLMKRLLCHYSRMALITFDGTSERHRKEARQLAAFHGLEYVELEGTTALLKDLATGKVNQEFIEVPPGTPLAYRHFFPDATSDAPPQMTPRA